MNIPAMYAWAVGVLFLGSALSAPSAARASEWKSRGEVALEARAFSNDQDPLTRDFGVGLFTQGRVEWRHGPWKARARAYARVDQQDPGRSLFLIEELWLKHRYERLDVGLGIDVVNWSVHEVFHPVDVLNARNFDSDFRRYEKKGEPMVFASYGFGRGGVEVFFMPRYSTPVEPSRASRLNFLPAELQIGGPLFMEPGGKVQESPWGLQGALRLTQSFGSADLSLHVVRHMDRSQPEPVFDNEVNLPRPLFRVVTQVGGTCQYAIDGFLLKAEGGYRIFAAPPQGRTRYGRVQERDHLVLAGGVEYGWTTADDLEVALFTEAQGIFLVDEAVRRQLSFFQRDVALGTRLTLGDTSATTLTVAAIIDLETPSDLVVTAELSRRLSDAWSLNVGAMLVLGRDRGIDIRGITLPSDSDHVRLSISRFF